MRRPLGDRLALHHRVILIDRPGHGWSSPAGEETSTPVAQGRMIEEALKQLDTGPVVLVVHSWAGALGARMALDYPARVAGLVMLAPVAYPWPGGVGWYNELVAKPVIGPLLAYTITLPLGYFLTERGAREVFLPQVMPDDFVASTATPLLLRPREFLANARDLVTVEASGHRAGAALWRNFSADGRDFGRRRQDRVDEYSFPSLCRGGAERQADRAARRRPHGAKRRARSRDPRDRSHCCYGPASGCGGREMTGGSQRGIKNKMAGQQPGHCEMQGSIAAPISS